MLIAPSILDVPDTALEQKILEFARAGAGWIHVDVIDWSRTPAKRNYDVPALRRARDTLQRNCLEIPFNVHLMVDDVPLYVDRYAAIADSITIQSTRPEHTAHDLLHLLELGIPAGLALNPDEPFSGITNYLGSLHHILFMSVFSGRGGQQFIEDVVPKIQAACEHRKHLPYSFLIGVDGGVNDKTAHHVRNLVDYAVAGSYIVKSECPKDTIAALRGEK